MDSPQKNLGSMDGKMPLLLLVMLAKKTMAVRPFQEATQLASAWALVNAGHFPVSYALGSAVFYALCYLQLLCRDSCEEDDAMHRALWIGQLCCAPLQAAAAALALLLPCRCRRICHALAYLAAAVAAVIIGCCILASFVPIAVDTGLGRLILLIVYVAAMFTLAVGDLSFLALLLGGEFPWEFR